MLNYLVWHDHGEAEELPAESDGNEDEDCMDEMVADIGREYKIGSGEQGEPSEVQNLYRLIATTDEKVHNGTDVTVLQAVTRLMMMKSKYNFSNQFYNDMVKLIIDLILMKHNMPKDLYQSKKIVVSLNMEYEKIDAFDLIQSTTPKWMISVWLRSSMNLLLAHQAQQVYYLSYPHRRMKNSGWYIKLILKYTLVDMMST
jgi:hypothetical protein